MKSILIKIVLLISWTLILPCITGNYLNSSEPIYRPFYTIMPSPDGNNIINSSGVLSESNYLEADLPEVPAWITAHPIQGGSVWYVSLYDGSVSRIQVKNRKIYSSIEYSGKSSRILIPLVVKRDNMYVMIPEKLYNWNYTTFPIPLGIDRYTYIDSSGNLYLVSGKRKRLISSGLLTDGRILVGNNRRILGLTGNSSDYRHGILGDTLEPTGFVIIETGAAFRKSTSFKLSGTGVFESLFPIWMDVNGDGKREVIVTRSSSQLGSWIQVYSEDGRLIAESNPIGKGHRWLHLAAAAGMGKKNRMEIISIKTPHIGGTLEFHRIVKNRLVLAHAVQGYSTHRIGSRNLHNAVVSDFNADGINDIILPVQDFTSLHNIQRTETGTRINIRLHLGSELSANLYPLVDGTGTLLLGAGLKNRRLRIYLAGSRKRLDASSQ